MKFIIPFVIISSFLFSFVSVSSAVEGADTSPEGRGIRRAPSILEEVGRGAGFNGTEPKHPAEVIGNYIKIALNVVGLVFLVLMVYGGYLWMTSRGNQERVTKAKDLITDAVIGLIIVLTAYIITHFVVEGLTKAVGIE